MMFPVILSLALTVLIAFAVPVNRAPRFLYGSQKASGVLVCLVQHATCGRAQLFCMLLMFLLLFVNLEQVAGFLLKFVAC